MADERIKKYWSREMDALMETYQQFQTLIPSEKNKGAAHAGEDGRYVEYLKRYLPKDLEVLTGFILRPAVVCGGNDKRPAPLCTAKPICFAFSRDNRFPAGRWRR